MSYAWREIGRFANTADAETWYRDQRIDHCDAQIRQHGDGVILSVRDTALHGKDDDPRRHGF